METRCCQWTSFTAHTTSTPGFGSDFLCSLILSETNC
jgi:hypothetical protein